MNRGRRRRHGGHIAEGPATRFVGVMRRDAGFVRRGNRRLHIHPRVMGGDRRPGMIRPDAVVLQDVLMAVMRMRVRPRAASQGKQQKRERGKQASKVAGQPELRARHRASSALSHRWQFRRSSRAASSRRLDPGPSSRPAPPQGSARAEPARP